MTSFVYGLFCLDYWYVIAYMGLMILSPVLNAFIYTAGKENLKKILLCYFAFSTVYGFLFCRNGFADGYSTIFFIGLYMLGRYLRLYPSKLTAMPKWVDALVYVISGSLTAILMCVFLDNSNNMIFRLLRYTSPFTIVSAVALLLFFSKLDFHSKVVNFVAESAFAVYLLHLHPCVTPLFRKVSVGIFERFDGVAYFAVIVAFIIAVFAIALALDRLRKLSWWGFAKMVGM